MPQLLAWRPTQLLDCPTVSLVRTLSRLVSSVFVFDSLLGSGGPVHEARRALVHVGDVLKRAGYAYPIGVSALAVLSEHLGHIVGLLGHRTTVPRS